MSMWMRFCCKKIHHHILSCAQKAREQEMTPANNYPVDTHSIGHDDSIIIDVTVSCGCLANIVLGQSIRTTSESSGSVKPFSRLIYYFFGYFDPKNKYVDNKNK